MKNKIYLIFIFLFIQASMLKAQDATIGYRVGGQAASAILSETNLGRFSPALSIGVPIRFYLGKKKGLAMQIEPGYFTYRLRSSEEDLVFLSSKTDMDVRVLNTRFAILGELFNDEKWYSIISIGCNPGYVFAGRIRSDIKQSGFFGSGDREEIVEVDLSEPVEFDRFSFFGDIGFDLGYKMSTNCSIEFNFRYMVGSFLGDDFGDTLNDALSVNVETFSFSLSVHHGL